MNLGQLRMLLRAKFLVDVQGLNKVRGQPFTISEITRGVHALLRGNLDGHMVTVNDGPAPRIEPIDDEG
jgi:hypothetical protein